MVQKKKKTGFWFALLLIIWFTIKIPYYIAKWIIHIIDNWKQKHDERKRREMEKKSEEKRGGVGFRYEKFRVLKKHSGNFDDWEYKVRESESSVGLILGARGSGKTAFGIKLLENIYSKTKKRCYALGFKKEEMPGWINVVENVGEIENDSIVLVDEGGVLFSSRRAMSSANKLLSELILVARHKNVSIIFISQNSSNLEVNVIRQADYIVLKQSSLLQKDFERKKIKDIYNEIEDDFRKFIKEKGSTYIYSDEFRGFVTNPLPSFWSTKISKSFR
jgi:Cdc6-like AAA superfamily ATPase